MIRALFNIFAGIVRAVLCLLLACALVVVGTNAAVVLSTKSNTTTLSEAASAASAASDASATSSEGYQYDAIVVLGASVYAGTLSDILKNRMDAAIELYKQGLAPVIIVSGDGRESNYNEPSAMKQYAIEQGVPADAIYCDPGGYRTYDSMWRVANVYGATSVVVVTQEYHLYRAVFDAQGVGMSALGVISDTETYDNQLWYEIREVAARVKDALWVLVGFEAENTTSSITLQSII